MKQADSTDDELAEYRALVDKVDAAVAAAAARAGEQVTCRAGCSSCCVDGLSVMPVEAHAIAAHVAAHGLDAVRASEDACVFLDGRGRCRVYAARPLGCRTFFCERAVHADGRRGKLPTATTRTLRPLAGELAALSPGVEARPLRSWLRGR